MIRAALDAAHGRRGEAAAILDVSRKPLRDKMRQHGLSADGE